MFYINTFFKTATLKKKSYSLAPGPHPWPADPPDYPVRSFEGRKRMILSTISWMGGKNPFLGIAYITVGSVCFFLGVVLLIIHHKCGNRSSSADISNWAAAALPPAPLLAPPPMLMWLSSFRGLLLVNSAWRFLSEWQLTFQLFPQTAVSHDLLWNIVFLNYLIFFIHHHLCFTWDQDVVLQHLLQDTATHSTGSLFFYFFTLRTVPYHWITVSPAHSAAWLASVVVVVVVGAAAKFSLLTVSGVTVWRRTEESPVLQTSCHVTSHLWPFSSAV